MRSLIKAFVGLLDEGLTQADVLAVLGKRTNAGDAMEAASAQYACDDVEIDPMPLISRGDKGTWVNAWVYVPDSELDI